MDIFGNSFTGVAELTNKAAESTTDSCYPKIGEKPDRSGGCKDVRVVVVALSMKFLALREIAYELRFTKMAVELL